MLGKVLRKCPEPTSLPMYRFFVYQALRGLQHVHAAGFAHCDLSPANLRVNEDCSVKLCGFTYAESTSRGESATEEEGANTGSAEGRSCWYRAPEAILSPETSTEKQDMWSVGCLLAEILAGKPLFPGKGQFMFFACELGFHSTLLCRLGSSIATYSQRGRLS